MVDGARMYSRLKTRTTQVGRTEAEVRRSLAGPLIRNGRFVMLVLIQRLALLRAISEVWFAR